MIVLSIALMILLGGIAWLLWQSWNAPDDPFWDGDDYSHDEYRDEVDGT